MADQFPGTEMTVIEKYPDSRRLDHPIFGDVAKTTFAKGVITDFKKVADDPIEVESLVKVDIGGDAWLPLFYHPKLQYWDGEEVLAQDFDETQGCFKRAWMSFRCGDEVAVMLQEGVPVGVVGFADGKPKIGEDIVQVTAPDWQGNSRFFHLQMSKISGGEDGLYGEINVAKKGPDGLELGLVEESETIGEDHYYRPAGPQYPDSSGDLSHYGILTVNNCRVWVNDNKQKYREFMFVVGPILYIVQVLATDATVLARGYYIPDGQYPPWHYEPLDLSVPDPYEVVSAGNCPGPPGVEDAITGPNFWMTIDVQYRAGIYSKELLAAIEAQGPISSEEAYKKYVADGWFSEWGTRYPNTFWQSASGVWNAIAGLFSFTTWPNWDETIFKVRPHN